MKDSLQFGSLCARDPQDPSSTQPHQLPIYPLSAFSYDSVEEGIDIFSGSRPGYIYGRFGNPTVDAVAAKLAQLESYGLDLQPTALLTSSGMAAIALPLMGLLRPGDAILTQEDLYGGTTELMRQVLQPLNIEPIFSNLRDLDAVETHLRQNPAIRLIYIETPSNPVLRCVDMEALSQLAKRYNCYTMVDNTFCSPVVQQPLAWGVDFVVHSATKYLNGHGNSICGVVIGRDPALMQNRLLPVLKLIGPNANAWDAWLLHNGLKTLALRVTRQCENALALAKFLTECPQVAHVNYPGLPNHPDYALACRQMRGFGGMLSFELKGGETAGKAFMNRLLLATIAATLGDTDTLVMHPATMSHRNIDPEVRLGQGITDGLVRMSVGIEDIADIIADVEQALSGG